MKWGDFIRLARERLKREYDADECAAVVHRLIEGRTGMRRIDQVLRQSEAIPTATATQLEEDLLRLEKGEPVQYILGRAPFMDMQLRVSPGVLIPRQETEELVKEAVARAAMSAENPRAPLRLLDIGTGSGCIAIALAKALPGALVYAVDASAAALEVAAQNAREQGLSISLLLSDVIAHDILDGAPFDLIVSNPPYIPENTAGILHRRVRDFEPALALFCPAADPLIFYRVIVDRAKQWLAPGGWLLFEIHAGTGVSVEQLLVDAGFCETKILRDLSGHERIVLGRSSVSAQGSGK